MKHFILTLLLMMVSKMTFAAPAKVILISDIDDTLKASHVVSWFDRLTEAVKTNNAYSSMADLMKSIDAKVFYVSNAPESLMGSNHRKFLSRNKFPGGEIHLRDSVWDQADKIPTLRDILNREKPTTVLMLGDNGESDPATYKQIQDEFPEVKFVSFIRWSYDPKQQSDFQGDQIPFVDAGEIALMLNAMSLLKDEYVLNVISSGARKLKLPEWVDCRGHFPWLPSKPQWKTVVERLSAQITQRCK